VRGVCRESAGCTYISPGRYHGCCLTTGSSCSESSEKYGDGGGARRYRWIDWI